MAIGEALFTSRHAWEPERIGALAIYCSDGRWGEAFDEFCHECLGIPRYDRFAVPGGPAWVAMGRAAILRSYDVAKSNLAFLVRAHNLRRIVLITHYGCAFYVERLKRDGDTCLRAQVEDLHTAAENLRGWFAGVGVEAYLAMRTEGQVEFHRVDV